MSSGPGVLFGLSFLFILVMIWTISIKGYALWHAARNTQKWWFIALLVLNTVGILEIIYLLWFRPETKDVAPLPPKTSGQPSQE